MKAFIGGEINMVVLPYKAIIMRITKTEANIYYAEFTVKPRQWAWRRLSAVTLAYHWLMRRLLDRLQKATIFILPAAYFDGRYEWITQYRVIWLNVFERIVIESEKELSKRRDLILEALRMMPNNTELQLLRKIYNQQCLKMQNLRNWINDIKTSKAFGKRYSLVHNPGARPLRKHEMKIVYYDYHSDEYYRWLQTPKAREYFLETYNVTRLIAQSCDEQTQGGNNIG